MNSDRFVTRGTECPLTSVFFPGWATDHRVFDSTDTPTNRLIPTEPFSESIHDHLAAYVRAKGLAPVNLIGWSLGAFVATEFARLHPDLVSSLVLCGARLRYPSAQIETARRGVMDDRQRFLTSFYRQCFLPTQKEDYQEFRSELMPVYLEDMSTDSLLASLDRLAVGEMDPANLPPHPIRMIHGAQDIVAPVDEAIAIAKSASNVRLDVLPDAGHAAFLTAEAREIIAQCMG